MSRPRQARNKLTRGRPGRIQRLNQKTRDYLDRRLREGATLEEVVSETGPMLEQAGEPPLSTSGLQRYTASVAHVSQRLSLAAESAKALTAKFDEKQNSGDLTKLTIQMIKTLIYEATLEGSRYGDDPDNPSFKPKFSTEQIGKLALAIRRLEDASKVNQQRERELREEIARNVSGATAGLTSETAAKIHRAIMGDE